MGNTDKYKIMVKLVFKDLNKLVKLVDAMT